MNAIAIETAFEIALKMFAAIQASHAAGLSVVPGATWDAALNNLDTDQAKLDADIAAAKAAGR